MGKPVSSFMADAMPLLLGLGLADNKKKILGKGLQQKADSRRTLLGISTKMIVKNFSKLFNIW